MGGATTLTESFPETSVVYRNANYKKDQNQTVVSVAPGEGKIPTDLMRDDTFDVDGFPHLHPTGRFGLNHPREVKLTKQQYFLQRLQNIDKRWSQNSAYLFAALYCIERESLERQINISYRRGKLLQGSLHQLEDAYSVFDNVPGTVRYWQQKRYEVLAKLEQLGPFQFFFTLSCADKRWDENFVSILRQKGIKIFYRKQASFSQHADAPYNYMPDEIWVKQDGNKEILLKEYLANDNLHELVRKNVLNITMNFDKRVHSFINRIIMPESSPMCTNFYHYRVEFQMRGAGHIHGVLWVNLPKLEEKFPGLQMVISKLKNSSTLTEKEKEVASNFVDAFVTCSLDIEALTDTVKEVQAHYHTATCRKHNTTCRFGYPRFPSNKTIIAQPLNKMNFSSERAYIAEKNKFKVILDSVKEVLTQLEEEQLKIITIEQILSKANVQSEDYYAALNVSQTGACVILKRSPKEIYINNYNPEWLKAWDGNMDLQVCLDFFAIITYITDYYTKSEAGMMSTLKDAAFSCKGKDTRNQMKFMAQTFLNHRQMGESEAFYRIFPHLHLSDSNLKCIFVASGFPENRSHFLRKVKDKIIENDVEEEIEKREHSGIQIPGKEGIYKRAIPVHEKYEARPVALKNICLAQFATSYDTMPVKSGNIMEFSNGVNGLSEEKVIASWNPEYETPLPTYIKLNNDLGYMKLRKIPSVLRIHKLKEDKDPHEFFYSYLLLYRPWQTENELKADDMDACYELYSETEEEEMRNNLGSRRSKIEKTLDRIFPHKNNVEAARAVLENLSNPRPTHIGDHLDPENEQENEELGLEGPREDAEYAARFPVDEIRCNTDELPPKLPYKRINTTDRKRMLESARCLDPDQRKAFDIMIEYVKTLRASERSGTAKPKPPLLKVHGGAGSGKSKFIEITASWCDKWLRHDNTNMIDPDKPTVVKVAPTGKAAGVIDGLTLHSAFHFNFGNEHSSLPDKLRETMRENLSNLTILIVDEMSMVKADLLYQIYLRLQEIKQTKQDFGGVAVILCGDLMQLKPVQGNWIFESPKNPQFQLAHIILPIWNLFQTIELTHNHRQGDDKSYGDLLNRLRI